MKKFLFSILGALTAVTLLFLAIGTIIFLEIPNAKEIRGCIVTKMYKVNLCPGSNQYVPLARISKNLQKIVILTEDSTFYSHNGFNWEEIEKSAKQNLKKNKLARGGSTITQQLAKNMFLTKEKSFVRKFIEALITIKIEKTLKKSEILERYLNVVEFGKNIYGVKAASEFYFKKPASDLDIVESAFLAMILPSPIKYSMSYYKKELTPFAKSRISRIINDLHQYNRIDDAEYSVALEQLNSFLSSGVNIAAPNASSDEDNLTIEDLESIENEE